VHRRPTRNDDRWPPSASDKPSLLSKQWVLDKLIENVNRAMQAEPVKLKGNSDMEKEVPGQYVYNGSVANKALELLGKELGMFIDRKEVGGPNEFARMSNEDLVALIEGCDSKIAAICNANGRSKHFKH